MFSTLLTISLLLINYHVRRTVEFEVAINIFISTCKKEYLLDNIEDDNKILNMEEKITASYIQDCMSIPK